MKRCFTAFRGGFGPYLFPFSLSFFLFFFTFFPPLVLLFLDCRAWNLYVIVEVLRPESFC